jgi:short-subunit dehydrogenase
MRTLTDQVAIVTGASSGIGAATARALARHGVHVVLAARRTDRLVRLAEELAQEHGVRTLVVPTDVSLAHQVDALVSRTVAEFGRIDILVNDAGVGLQGDLAGLTEKDLRYVFDVNVFGAVHAMQAVIPIMRGQGGGVIVNVGSILGEVPVPSLGMVGSSAGYTASKHALSAFSAAARMELAEDKIRVITVLPGVTQSEFDEHFIVTTAGAERRVQRKRGVLGLVPAEVVAERIVRAIARGERTVYITFRDRAVVKAAALLPGPTEWGLRQLRAVRTGRLQRRVRKVALVGCGGATALAAAAIAAVALIGWLVRASRRRA